MAANLYNKVVLDSNNPTGHCEADDKNVYIKYPNDEGAITDGYLSNSPGEYDPLPRTAGELCDVGQYC